MPIGEGPATSGEHDAAPRARVPQKTRAKWETADGVKALSIGRRAEERGGRPLWPPPHELRQKVRFDRMAGTVGQLAAIGATASPGGKPTSNPLRGAVGKRGNRGEHASPRHVVTRPPLRPARQAYDPGTGGARAGQCR